MVQQSDRQCECGSWYHCNRTCKCGRSVTVPAAFYSGEQTMYNPTKKGPRGAGWDKKQHKVIWN